VAERMRLYTYLPSGFLALPIAGVLALVILAGAGAATAQSVGELHPGMLAEMSS